MAGLSGHFGRRIRPLTAADVAQLPDLHQDPARSPHPRTGGPSATWAPAVEAAWGLCGVGVSQDARMVGYLTFAPARLAPSTGRYANAHLGSDVGVLLEVVVAAEHRGRGLGRHLVQSAAAELARRDVAALEALGSTDPDGAGPGGIPLDFLLAVGFRVVADHPTTPRLRMDLGTTVRWRPDLAAAWRRLTGLVSQPTPPQPAGFEHPRQAEPVTSGR